MKSIKMALLGGAALAVTAAGAQADDLDALKAQIEELNARVAAMETAPSVPAGYQLIAISEGELQQTPGLTMSAREKFSYGNRSTIISVLPTADAPAGTTISWSGYVYAGLRYMDSERSTTIRAYDPNGSEIEGTRIRINGIVNLPDFVSGVVGSSSTYNTVVVDGGTTIGTAEGFLSLPIEVDNDPDGDWDVPARGQLRVVATTDTAVGEVGVDIRLRGNFNGNGAADAYMDVAWGYWAMTPELTFGGGYAESLGKINYGYSQGCTCYLTANGPFGLDPGDVSQLRLSYGSGPFTMAIAVEDAGIRAGGANFSGTDVINSGELGAAGTIGYSGDLFSGEIAGMWRSVDDETTYDADLDGIWQVGAGIKFGFTEMFSLQFGAAMGEGPVTTVDDGNIVAGIPYTENWWTVSGLASASLSDEFSAELGVAYTDREGDEFDAVALGNLWESDGVEYSAWGILGGVYYTPVDQLTIGVEGEWWTADSEFSTEYVAGINPGIDKVKWESESDNWSVDLIAVWRF